MIATRVIIVIYSMYCIQALAGDAAFRKLLQTSNALSLDVELWDGTCYVNPTHPESTDAFDFKISNDQAAGEMFQARWNTRQWQFLDLKEKKYVLQAFDFNNLNSLYKVSVGESDVKFKGFDDAKSKSILDFGNLKKPSDEQILKDYYQFDESMNNENRFKSLLKKGVFCLRNDVTVHHCDQVNNDNKSSFEWTIHLNKKVAIDGTILKIATSNDNRVALKAKRKSGAMLVKEQCDTSINNQRCCCSQVYKRICGNSGP